MWVNQVTRVLQCTRVFIFSFKCQMFIDAELFLKNIFPWPSGKMRERCSIVWWLASCDFIMKVIKQVKPSANGTDNKFTSIHCQWECWQRQQHTDLERLCFLKMISKFCSWNYCSRLNTSIWIECDIKCILLVILILVRFQLRKATVGHFFWHCKYLE